MKAKAIERLNESLKSIQFAVTPKDVAFGIRQAMTRLGKVATRDEVRDELTAVEKHYEGHTGLKRKEFDTMELFHAAFVEYTEKTKELIEALKAKIETSELPEGAAGVQTKLEVPGKLIATGDPISVNVGSFTLHFLRSKHCAAVLNGTGSMGEAMAKYLEDEHKATLVDGKDYYVLYRGLRRTFSSFLPKPEKPAKEKKEKKPKGEKKAAPKKKAS